MVGINDCRARRVSSIDVESISAGVLPEIRKLTDG